MLFTSSCSVSAPTKAFARDTGSAEGLQTRLLFSGPFAQSGNAARAVWDAAAETARMALYEKRGIEESSGESISTNSSFKLSCTTMSTTTRRRSGQNAGLRYGTIDQMCTRPFCRDDWRQ